MSGKVSLLIIAILGSALSVSAQRSAVAQSRSQNDAPQQSAQRSTSDASTDSADIAITATVTAKELKFEVVPNPTVEFPGTHERETIWDAERDNLPRPVEPGVTYRNIGIRLKIVSRFADIERIVAEALGETPVTDSVPSKEDASPQQQRQPPASTSQPNGGGQPK